MSLEERALNDDPYLRSGQVSNLWFNGVLFS